MSTGTVYPVAPGNPDHSGVAIPTIYSARLQDKFYNATVFASIANTNWEGEIKKQGDKVVIRDTPSTTTFAYSKGQNIEYEDLEPGSTNLLIDKGRGWAFKLDDVDIKQIDYDAMNDWATDASKQLKLAVDSGILADVYDDVSAYNYGLTAGKTSNSFNLGVNGTPVALTRENVIDTIAAAGTVLDESATPEGDRWFVIPPWMCYLLTLSDLKDASMTGRESTLPNGRLGNLLGFTLYKSNQLDTTTDGANTVYNMIFGHRSALTFAAQMTKAETLTLESTFAKAMRGLMVYGYKVVNTEQMGWLYGYKA